MSDDLVPEEGKQEYHQLLAVLRSSSQRRVTITAGEQTQIITRVQERLTPATSASTLPEDVGVLSPRRRFTHHTPIWVMGTLQGISVLPRDFYPPICHWSGAYRSDSGWWSASIHARVDRWTILSQ